MQVVERSQLRKLPSSDDIDRQQGVAMSITVTMSAIQSHTPDVNADEMPSSRRSLSLISISADDGHPCCRRSRRFLCSFLFSLTGTIFLSIFSHFARIQSSRSQYFTSTNHLSCGFYLYFYWRFASKAPCIRKTSYDWSTAVMSQSAVNSDARSIQIFSKYSNTLVSKRVSSCSAIRPNYQSQPPLLGFTYIGA